ncbi:hypothetical protein ACET3X_003616 [Alternaria dauci]|uniref:Histone H1 n=1 Tax=Alternaria dauci TaxID=48095 RepID=A0ABR3UV78_9PLEO
MVGLRRAWELPPPILTSTAHSQQRSLSQSRTAPGIPLPVAATSTHHSTRHRATPKSPIYYFETSGISKMAATTRATTGNSKPRLVQQIENAIAPTKRSTTTKANTSKPRTSKVASGRVAKPKSASTTTTTKKTTTAKKPAAAPKKTTGANVKTVKKPRTKTEKVVDKIVGTAEHIVGDVEGKPGKKAAGTAKARGTDSTTTRAAPRTRGVKA